MYWTILSNNAYTSSGIAWEKRIGLDERQFQFEWDEAKAVANLRKHGVSFELASSIFGDPRILTLADTTHSESEERWFSIGVGEQRITAVSSLSLDGSEIAPHQD